MPRLPRRGVLLALAAIGLGLLVAAGYGLVLLTDTAMTRDDKVGAVRSMVDWAIAGKDLPGWDGKNPLLDECRKAKSVAVVYRFHDKEPRFDMLLHDPKADRDRTPLTFSDPRVRVAEVPVVGGAVGDQGEVTLFLESDGDLGSFNPTLTIWTPAVKGDYRLSCRWSKRLGRPTVQATPETRTPGAGWEPAGKTKKS